MKRIVLSMASFVLAVFVLADANASAACRIRKAAWAAQYGDTMALAQLTGTAAQERVFAVDASGAVGIASPKDAAAAALAITTGSGGGAPLPAPVTPVEAAVQKSWVLEGGKSIRPQVEQWAKNADWRLNWRLDVDWVVPSTVSFDGMDFPKALSSVVEALYAQGKPVRLKLWMGNRVAEVVSNDVK